MFNLKIEANLAKFVCMNTSNSETISAEMIKRGDNDSDYSTQLNCILSFCHAPLRALKLKKCYQQVKFQFDNY